MSLGVEQRPDRAAQRYSYRAVRATRGWAMGCSTPTRIRQLAALVGVSVIALCGIFLVRIDQAQAGLTLIGHRAEPEVAAAADLYFALNDMDAQVANVLLVGDRTGNGITRDQALQLYEQRRTQADRAVRTVAEAADGDPATSEAVDQILDALGDYEVLVARTQVLAGQHPHPVARPDAAALAEYRRATDLSRTRLLPAVRRLADGHAARLEARYTSLRTQLLSARTVVVCIGVVALVGAIGLQFYLARRFRRVFSPGLAAATVLIGVGVVLGSGLLTQEAEQLRTATKDAFDSLFALRSARAISYDANADESRYLLDPARAGQYEQAFLEKSQQLAESRGATVSTLGTNLATAVAAYHRDQRDVGWGGYLGTEFRNITFPGERSAAELTVARYQAYLLDDRRIRSLAGSGHLAEAVAFCTDYSPGGSNDAFDQYDKAISALIDINQQAFDRSIGRGEGRLRGWTAGCWAGGMTVLLLLGAGTYGRLREYRPARST